ncbi:MAG: hypothetical protein ABR499_02705 [Gemmatimonadaceae bacterium]
MAGRRKSPAQSQATDQSSSQSSSATDTVERRKRLALRALVEEMLNEIRSAAGGNEDWTPEERSRAEADLARIMDQVRREAFRNSPAE